MKTLYTIYESLLDDIEASLKQGDEYITNSFIRELYFSNNRKTINKNWKLFKDNCLGNEVDPKQFKKGKLYIGVCYNDLDYPGKPKYKTITHFGIIKAGKRILYRNQSNFLNSTPVHFGFDIDENDYPIYIKAEKGKFFDFNNDFSKNIELFTWYELPDAQEKYVEKVIIQQAHDEWGKAISKSKQDDLKLMNKE